jgi:hypothetical protein
MQRCLCRNNFWLADCSGTVNDLPLQVAEVYGVVIAQSESTDAACRKVQRRRRTQSPQPDNQGMASQQALLPLNADFIQQNVAAIA